MIFMSPKALISYHIVLLKKFNFAMSHKKRTFNFRKNIKKQNLH